MEAEGRLRICHDASNRAHGANCLPHFLAFYSAGADGTDEADEHDHQSVWFFRCIQSRDSASTCVPLCASLYGYHRLMMSRVAETLSVNTNVISGSLCAPLSLISTCAAQADPRVHVQPGFVLGRRTVVVSLRLPHAIFSSHSECFGEAERFGGGEMVMFRVKERGEGGEEDLTGSMLPTYGEDAHLQPTDASTPHSV